MEHIDNLETVASLSTDIVIVLTAVVEVSKCSLAALLIQGSPRVSCVHQNTPADTQIHSFILSASKWHLKSTGQCSYKQDNKAENCADSRPRENTQYT